MRGGFYAHWVPCHQLNQTEFEVILASFSKCFRRSGIVANESEVPSYGRRSLRIQKWSIRFSGSIADVDKYEKRATYSIRLVGMRESIAMHYIGRLKRDGATRTSLNTLNNIWLELHGGLRNSVQTGLSLTDANWPQFEADLFQRVEGNPNASGDLSKWRAVGRKISRWYYAASATRTKSQLLQDAQDSLPKTLSDDADADWTF